jgi:hypothetical protein
MSGLKDPDAVRRSLQGRIGAYALHARHDSREITAPARAAFLRTFEDQVDPERQLPLAERDRRASMARRAHMARLAYQSARARQIRGRPRRPPSSGAAA